MADSLPDISKFNIRNYGLLFNNKNEVLLSDEIIRGEHFTKFPGGGLEFGESPIECLHREFLEEMNQKIEVASHFYTTDKFIRSAFRPKEQVICIYHIVNTIGGVSFKTSTNKFNFNTQIEGDQEAFRWCKISDLNPKDFAFLSDAEVVKLIKRKLS